MISISTKLKLLQEEIRRDRQVEDLDQGSQDQD